MNHTDERGSFEELLKSSECGHEIKQISRLTINPGRTRGNHYHRLLTETFVVLQGDCMVNLFDRESPGEYQAVRMLTKGQSMSAVPNIHHTFYSESGCDLLVVSSKEFDPNDTDTYSS